MAWNRGPKAFTAGVGGVAPYRLVKISSGTVVHSTADATDDTIGVTLSGVAEGESVSVALLNTGGTLELTASEAIAAGAKVYTAADGKIQDLPVAAGTYRLVGIAMKAASGDGAVIEVLPMNGVTTATV